MITISRRAALKGATAAGSALAAAALVAACSSSSNSSSPASTGAAGGSGGASVTVQTHSGPLGTFLTTASGKSLYMFDSDTATKSTCNGGCASFWPPLTVTGTPTVSGSTPGSTITTLTRSDGSKQVVYDGHPLYTFLEDTKAGQTNGQGSDDFGAKWWLLAPSGQPITGSGSASSPPSSSSAGGGGGAY